MRSDQPTGKNATIWSKASCTLDGRALVLGVGGGVRDVPGHGGRRTANASSVLSGVPACAGVVASAGGGEDWSSSAMLVVGYPRNFFQNP